MSSKVRQVEVAFIDPDGTVGKKTIRMDFEGLQEAVGGYIQQLYLAPGIWAWVNEEGKIDNLPVNPKATAFCHLVGPNIAPDDYVVGTMIVTGKEGKQKVTDKAWALIEGLTTKEPK